MKLQSLAQTPLSVDDPAHHETPQGLSRQTGPWESPLPLDEQPVPRWPDHVFPAPVQEYVDALARTTETPPELAALCTLAVLATAVQRSYVLEVKPGYREKLCLWTCTVLPSGSRKSPVVEAAKDPLVDWERSQKQKYESDVRRNNSQCEAMEQRIAVLRKRVAEANDPAQREYWMKEIEEVEAEKPQHLHLPRLWTTDITPERLAGLMAQQGECMSVISAEGGIFETVGGRYARGVPNLDALCQAWSGDSIRVDRVGRNEPVFLDEPRLSMGLAVQPEVLKEINAKSGFRGRGLLARFLFAVPPNLLGSRTGDTPPIPGRVREAYHDTVRTILDGAYHGLDIGPHAPRVLHLDTQAADLWQRYWQSVESDMRDGGRFSAIRDWAGKIPGNAARVAAVLHAARHAPAPENHLVSAQDMRSAVELCSVLSDHALVAFDAMGADPVRKGARAILAWLRQNGRHEFTRRDLQHGMGSRFGSSLELDAPLALLQDRGWARELRSERSGPGRRAELYEVNPAIETYRDHS